MAAPSKPSGTTYSGTVVGFVVYAVVCGYIAATASGNGWQSPFSWHPFLMTTGMISTMGIGAMTKKLGGYSNVKSHAILGWLGIFLSMGGLYAIYSNKEKLGRPHLTSNHSLFGAAAAASCLGLGIVGSVVLHPDFGLDKTNKTIRFAHKMGARVTLALAWTAAFSGLYQMSPSTSVLIAFGAPLLVFAPLALM